MRTRSTIRKIWSLCYLSGGGAVVYGAFSLYEGNEKFYKTVAMPAVRKLEPETAHRLAVVALKYNLVPKSRSDDPTILATTLFGKQLSNPLGIAAGFDKNGEAIRGLNGLGFGFIEIGTVTPKPQPGNEKPRVFRLVEDRAVINRYGFNGDGHDAVLKRLTDVNSNWRAERILGVNLGKNKDSQHEIDDYLLGIDKFGPESDYLVVNVSSPNTPGLRNLQNKDKLRELLSQTIARRDALSCSKKPEIYLKLAPDLTTEERKDVAKVIGTKTCRVDGLIVCNTTIQRHNLKNESHASETGGLSGEPLKTTSTEMIREMYNLTGGRIPIIGVGGVFSGRDAFEKILAGASAIQIYTSLIYEGPTVVAEIKQELAQLLQENGYNNVREAVGGERVKKR